VKGIPEIADIYESKSKTLTFVEDLKKSGIYYHVPETRIWRRVNSFTQHTAIMLLISVRGANLFLGSEGALIRVNLFTNLTISASACFKL